MTSSVKSPLRVGLIGLGAVGIVHLEAYHAASGIAVVAAADLDEQRLCTLSERFGFRPYTEYRLMLAQEKLDIVCVLTPASLHRAMVIECAAAGTPVLTEKPMASSLTDADAMFTACQAVNVPLFYGSSYRYLPAIRAARKVIQSGDIGEIVLVRESAIGGSGPELPRAYGPEHYPVGGPGGSGMGLVDHGVHLIDIFAWLIDSPVISVFGSGNISGGELCTEYALLNFASGATGHLVYNDGTWPIQLPGDGMFSAGAGWTLTGLSPPGEWEPEPGWIEIYGTNGALRVYHYANALFIRDSGGMRQLQLPDKAAPWHFVDQIKAFAKNLATGNEPDTPATVGIQALRVIEAIYQSARDRRVIDI
jgi:predicted dehydrogenase